jgi:hypothetical protein
MKKFGLPRWFPYPHSWINALILSLLMTGLIAVLRNSSNLHRYILKSVDKPEILTVLVILLLILPIPAFAVFHHLVLSRLIPAIPGERIRKKPGIVPGLISWWESLYSWLVLLLSTLIAILCFTPFLPLFNLNYEKIFSANSQPHKNIQAIFVISWITSAAILFQIEYLFKNRLVFGDFQTYEPETTNPVESVEIEEENDNKEIGVTQMQPTEQLPVKKPTRVNILKKYRKLPEKIFTLILVPLVAIWIYMFANLPETQQILSTNLTLENPSPVTPESAPENDTSEAPTTPEPAPEDDTYEEAMDKANLAKELTKIAQTQDEWKVVLSRWEEAIELMRAVPTSSSNFVLAEEKILQYQIHRDFAKYNATSGL